METIRTSVPTRRLAPMAAALAACSLAAPAMAEQAPGWLNWGGGSSQEQSADSSAGQPAAAQSTAKSVPVADTGNQSGQAVLLQRLMQRVDELERQMQSVRGQLSEHDREIQRQSKRVDKALEAARSQPAQAPANTMSASGGGMSGPSAPTSPQAPEAPSAPASPQGSGQQAQASGGDGTAAAASGAAAQGAGAAEKPAGTGTVSDKEQQALYNKAFEVLKSGDYDAAIDAFQKVIDANPQGSWAPSAFFWQGETYYVKQDYEAAGKSYSALVQQYPDSRRVPDAKLKLGYVAQEQGDDAAARRLFNEVVSDYPDSQAAGLAKQRLSRMGGG